MKSAIVLFFLFFIISIYLIFDLKNKPLDKDVAVLNSPIIEQKSQDISSKSLSNNDSHDFKLSLESKELTLKEKEESVNHICSVFGPVNNNLRSKFEALLNKDKVAFNRKTNDSYSVFWNLGKEESQAKSMFEIQKKGALQDDKFQLVNRDNNWIVPIATVGNNKATAEKLTNQLKEKADIANAGGQWEFKNTSNYFYNVDKSNLISQQSIEQVKQLGISIKDCS